MKADQSLIEFKKGIVDEYGMYKEDYDELKSYEPDTCWFEDWDFIAKDYDEELYRIEEESNKEIFSGLGYEDVYSDEEYEKDLEIEIEDHFTKRDIIYFLKYRLNENEK